MSKNKEKHHPAAEDKTNVPATVKTAVEPDAEKAPARTETKPAPRLTEAEKLEKAGQEIAGLNDRLLRLRADFENFRKRSLREKLELYESANEALMLELLPILDHLQLAVNSAREHQAPSTDSTSSPHAGSGQADKAFQEGIRLIYDQTLAALAKHGLEPFNSEKQVFDPKLHEAISTLPSDTIPEGVIITQSRQGYRFKNMVLRPAQVVVSSGPSKVPETKHALVKEKPNN
jgi:molecular chaperone GrpE